MPSWIKETLRASPIGVGLPLVIGAASIGPDDAASNISKWINRAGFTDLPAWVLSKSADHEAILTVSGVSCFYILAIWILPALLRKSVNVTQSNIHVPPLGSLQYVTAILEVHISRSRQAFSGLIRVELNNTTDKLIRYRAVTAGRINGVPFGFEKAKFEGFIYPNQPSYLLSRKLPEMPLRPDRVDGEPIVRGIYEYDLEYGYADTKEFARKTGRGIQIDFYGPLQEKPVGTIEERKMVVIIYSDTEE